MAPTVFGGSRSSAATNAQFAFPMLGLSTTATESIRQWPVRKAGSFSRMAGVFNANGTARAAVIRKNGGNSGLGIVPPDSTAGTFKDYANVAHFAVGDTFDYEPTFTGTGFILSAMTCLFSADAGTVGFYPAASISTVAGVTVFNLPGGLGQQTVDTNTTFLVRAAGTWSNLVGSVPTNAATGTNVVSSRKNSAAGNMTFTVGAGLTGIFEDLTHSDTAASGDTIGHQIVTAASSAISIQVGVICTFNTTTSELCACGPGLNFNASNQFWWISPTAVFTTESLTSIPLGIDATLSNLRLSLVANAMTGTFTFNFRKNGVNANQVITCGAGTTGSFEDASRTDKILTTDVVNFMGSGGTSGTLSSNFLAMALLPVPSFGYFEPLSEAMRTLPRSPAALSQFSAAPPFPPIISFGWFEPLAEPVRTRPGLLPGQQQFAAQDTAVIPVSRMMPWFTRLAEPVRNLPGLTPSQQQFQAYAPDQITITPFAWFQSLAEPPVKTLPGLKPSQQQFIAAPPQLRPNPNVTGTLSAQQTRDVFLGSVASFNRVVTGEIGVIEKKFKGAL